MNNTIDRINISLLELLNTQNEYLVNGHDSTAQKAYVQGIRTALENALLMQNNEHTHYTLTMYNGKYCIIENNYN